MLNNLCQELTRQECDTLKFMCERDIPRARLESIQGLQDFFRVLENQRKLSPDYLEYLLHMLKQLNRQDLVRKVEQFRNTGQRPCAVDRQHSENIAVSLTEAATNLCDQSQDNKSRVLREVAVRQHQQQRASTDRQTVDNRTTVDERTIHRLSRQIQTGLLSGREDDALCIGGEVFNVGRPNGVQAPQDCDIMPYYSMRRKPRGNRFF